MILASIENQVDNVATLYESLHDIYFPRGIIGFEDYTQYSINVIDKGPLHSLNITSDSDIFFYVINPYLVRKDYVLDVSEEYYRLLEKPEAENIVVFSIITMNTIPQNITCNLVGPVVINILEKIGCQCINNSENVQWQTKHTLFDGNPV